jgi:hypothetical protein
MNIAEEFLIGIASIPISLIGFSGGVTALCHWSEGKWMPSEMLQLTTPAEPGMISPLEAFVLTVLGLSIHNP